MAPKPASAAATANIAPIRPGAKVTVALDDGQVVIAYVVEDLGLIGRQGRRLLRVSSEEDPSSETAVVFDLPFDPERTTIEAA